MSSMELRLCFEDGRADTSQYFETDERRLLLYNERLIVMEMTFASFCF